MDDLDHQRAVWAFGSTTPRENQKWFFYFFLGSVKTGVEPNILVRDRDLYASTVSSFREIIHFLPAKKPKMITRLSFRYFTIVCLDSHNRPQKYSHFSRYQFEFLEGELSGSKMTLFADWTPVRLLKFSFAVEGNLKSA